MLFPGRRETVWFKVTRIKDFDIEVLMSNEVCRIKNNIELKLASIFVDDFENSIIVVSISEPEYLFENGILESVEYIIKIEKLMKDDEFYHKFAAPTCEKDIELTDSINKKDKVIKYKGTVILRIEKFDSTIEKYKNIHNSEVE